MSAIVVTGANGFVGRRTCELLVSQGRAVTGATRVAVRLPDGVRPAVVGDIGPQTNWMDALSGCEVVVHLAARVHVDSADDSDAAAFRRVNVEGSERLARQAAGAGVQRLVYLSSVKVNGERSPGRPFLESDPQAPADAYGASKAEAEMRLKAVAAETGMEVVILRSPLVYGPGVKANFLRLMRLVDAGIPLPFSSIDNRRSLVGLANLAHAIGACATHPAAAGRTFFVSDGQDASTPGLVRELAAALRRPARLFPFPASLLKAASRIVGRAEEVARLTDSLQVDTNAIRASLAWAPVATLRDGLRETAAWYRSPASRS